MGPVTHNWDWGNRYVKLAPDGKTTDGDRALKFKAPKEPGLAVPGDYMLFVVDDKGIPSVAKRVHLGGGDQ
jgi:hypothetical protein